MTNGATILLTKSDVAALLDADTCIAAVERAFLVHGQGRAAAPVVAGVHAERGGFHIKAGLLQSSESGASYFVAKANANFPENGRRFGLPTIQGTIVLCDAVNGRPLAVMDSSHITTLRTAAATAIAARYLARPAASSVAVIGCGVQGRAQLRALSRVRPLDRAYVYDVDVGAAERLAIELGPELGIPIEVVRDAAGAALRGDICVTCTPSTSFLVGPEVMRPGMFLAGVGADSEEKRELMPELLARGRLVVDVLEQCARLGDLHHALEAGVLTRADVHAELGEVVAGRKPGRRADDEVFVFDSTGMALQDAAAAAVVYERAAAGARGVRVDLTS